MIPDEDKGILSASFQNGFESYSTNCQSIGSDEKFLTYPIALTLTQPFPPDITSPYNFQLQSQVIILQFKKITI